MKVLAEKPELAYAIVLLEGLDRDDLVKRAELRNGPIQLSDGRRVGVLLSTGVAPDDFTLGGVRYPRFETTVGEIVWANAGIASLAKNARLEVSDRGVRLLGSEPERVRKAAPRTASGWGQRLVAGETIRFV
jgi:hypothetical protein